MGFQTQSLVSQLWAWCQMGWVCTRLIILFVWGFSFELILPFDLTVSPLIYIVFSIYCYWPVLLSYKRGYHSSLTINYLKTSKKKRWWSGKTCIRYKTYTKAYWKITFTKNLGCFDNNAQKNNFDLNKNCMINLLKSLLNLIICLYSLLTQSVWCLHSVWVTRWKRHIRYEHIILYRQINCY